MRREFLLNIVVLISVNLLIKPFYTFFIETDVQNLVGPGEYGLYFSVFNLSYIFQIFLDLGIHNYGSQYLAKDRTATNQYLSKALVTKGYLTLVFALVIMLSGYVLGYDASMIRLLILVSINQVFISLIFFFRSSLAALGHYRSNSFISVLDKIIMISAFGYVLFIASGYRESFSIYHFVGIRMATYALTTVISLALLLRFGGFRFTYFIDLGSIKVLIKDSLPFAILVVFMGLCNRTDAVMLERIVDDGGIQAGIYAASYRVYYAMNTLGFLFSMLLLPMFSNLIVTDMHELDRLVDLSLKSILALSVGAVSVLYVTKEEMMALLYKSDADLYGTEILVLLSLTLILTCVIYIFGTLLTAHARLKYLNYVFIFATMINISVNYFLIPLYGAIGAAWATLVTEVVVVIAQYLLCYKIVSMRLPMRSIIGITIFTIAIAGISYYTNSLITVGLMPKVAIVAISTTVIGLATQMIDYTAIRGLLTRA